MKESQRVPVLILTHALALVAGWAVYASSGASASHIKDRGASTATTAKSETRDPATEQAAREILGRALAPKALGPFDSPSDPMPPGPRQVRDEVRDLLDDFIVPDDIEAALNAAMAEDEKPDNELWKKKFALYYHWLASDPAACFKWAQGERGRFGYLDGVVIEAGPEFYRRLGAEKALEMISHAPSEYYQIRGEVGRSIGEHADAAGAIAANKMMSGQMQEWFARQIGGEWPHDKVQDLVKAAVDSKQPMLVIGYEPPAGKTPGEFLASLVMDESLPQEFRDALRSNEWAKEALAQSAGIPPAMRLELGTSIEQICSGDMIKLLTTDRDWAFAFRHGAADAADILALAEAGAPELMRDHGAKAREYLFRELAEENPQGAMALLQDLPEAERGELALLAARTHFESVEPSKFLELLEQVPSDTPELWEARLDAWNLRGATNHKRLQDGYVAWVHELPPGLDREMGLYSLARAVQESDPQFAAELRREVKDPELQRRISSSR